MSGCCVYDFRISKRNITIEHLRDVLKETCKKWVFQEEKGEETGYLHYQGRISLKMKARQPEILKKFQALDFNPNYLSETSKENRTNTFYVTKDETRVSGPYKDTDKEIFIPEKYKQAFANMYPYQKAIFNSGLIYDDRGINCLINEEGNKGKSTIAMICMLFSRGIIVPPLDDAKELVQAVCDICMSKEERSPSHIIIDLPRAMDKKKMRGMINAIEQIKNGYLYDTRHRYKEWIINPPQIWVFTNKKPDLTLLSADRWKLWTINDSLNLEKFVDEENDE